MESRCELVQFLQVVYPVLIIAMSVLIVINASNARVDSSSKMDCVSLTVVTTLLFLMALVFLVLTQTVINACLQILPPVRNVNLLSTIITDLVLITAVIRSTRDNCLPLFVSLALTPTVLSAPPKTFAVNAPARWLFIIVTV